MASWHVGPGVSEPSYGSAESENPLRRVGLVAPALRWEEQVVLLRDGVSTLPRLGLYPAELVEPGLDLGVVAPDLRPLPRRVGPVGHPLGLLDEPLCPVVVT